MEITSNLSSSHGSLVANLLADASSELFFVSPFLTGDFGALFKEADFSSVTYITLVTTLKKNDQDQITKPKSLKSFYHLAKAKCPKPSLDPIVTTASLLGSKITEYFLSYQSHIDFLNLGIPFD